MTGKFGGSGSAQNLKFLIMEMSVFHPNRFSVQAQTSCAYHYNTIVFPISTKILSLIWWAIFVIAETAAPTVSWSIVLFEQRGCDELFVFSEPDRHWVSAPWLI